MNFGESQRPEFPGAVPFPSLWRLDIGYVYPFGDDMVFRGNAVTLESLILKPSPGTVRILKEYRVFTPVSHPRLQHVRVLLKPNSEPNIFASDVDYMRFVLSIGSSAPVRTMFDRLNNPGLQSILPVLGEHTCIQVLALGMLHLDLWEAIALVKALPLLSDLYTADPTIVPWPVPMHKLPAHVIANYAPTGNRLRCWHFDINSDNGLKNVVRCVLLLALVCQNFDYADVGIIYIATFMSLMKRMVTTDGFRPHATRLRRLLFGGSRNEIPSVKTLEARRLEYLAAVNERMNRQNIEAAREE
ncbi:hypothetical protein H4R27_000371 [Coemansia aciculifera]|nr:hypothetical protein H4R27_000371 [Coemansia aciculifera]